MLGFVGANGDPFKIITSQTNSYPSVGVKMSNL